MAAIDGDKVFVVRPAAAWRRHFHGGRQSALEETASGARMYTSSPLVYGEIVIYLGRQQLLAWTPLDRLPQGHGRRGLDLWREVASERIAPADKINGREQVVHIDHSRTLRPRPADGQGRCGPIAIPEMEKSKQEGSPIRLRPLTAILSIPRWPECPTVQIDGGSVKELW